MKKIYWLITLAGFGGTLVFILGPYILGQEVNLLDFSDGSSALSFIWRYYLLALVFFAIIVFVLSGLRRPEDAHSMGKRFAFSLIGFSLGSWLASILFLLILGLIWSGSRPEFF